MSFREQVDTFLEAVDERLSFVRPTFVIAVTAVVVTLVSLASNLT